MKISVSFKDIEAEKNMYNYFISREEKSNCIKKILYAWFYEQDKMPSKEDFPRRQERC